jgi:hypothetical protein
MTERPRDLIPGSGRRGKPRRLEHVVSVRVDGRLLAEIRAYAEADGVDYSKWMRNAVAAEVHRRQQPPAIPGLAAVGWACDHMRVTSAPGTLGKASCGSGCEMWPVYERAA